MSSFVSWFFLINILSSPKDYLLPFLYQTSVLGKFVMKKNFYTEAAYIIGIITLALGTALMERADFGMSMVVAPAYLVYLKISEYLPWFSFGIAEYCLQALLIIVLMVIMQSYKRKYLFSFMTAFIYGTVLDLMIRIVGFIPGYGYFSRVLFYLSGLLLCSIGVSLLFQTYISPEAYEMFVKEISVRFGFDINKTKTVYDCVSCIVAIVMSFSFMGFLHFEGVKAGTVFCALINGWIIGQCTRFFESVFIFKDAYPLRKYFQ